MKRGGQKILLDGFIYTKKKESADGIIWRCAERNGIIPCSASMKSDLNLQNPQLLKQHIHGANHNKVNVQKCRHEMKVRAKTSLDKPNQIYVHANADLKEEARATLPNPETIKRVLRRTRSENRPPEPRSLRDFQLVGDWTLTRGNRPENFILHDNGVNAQERMIIFAKQSHVQKLSECQKWCMDGNFAVAPDLFMQLYVILGKVGDTFLPFYLCPLGAQDSGHI